MCRPGFRPRQPCPLGYCGNPVVVNNFDEFGDRNHDILEPNISGLTVSRNFLRTENPDLATRSN